MHRLWIALALLLAACSKKEPPPQPKPAVTEPPQSATPASDPRPALLCFGDSITAGFGLEPGESFPDLLQKDLPQYHVINMGISGDTTQDGLSRVAMAVGAKPAIVLLELGGNDGLRGIPISITQSNLAQMIESFQSAGARVVLAGMSLPPNYGAPYIAQFEKVYRDLAAKYKVKLIPFLLEGVGGHDDLMQRDRLHPNAAGARKVEQLVLKALS
jgi:acyl-CoA thioesterase-1